MTRGDAGSRFRSKLFRPVVPGDDASWAFVVLPQEASATLPRRGRTTVEGTLDGHGFRATLEPDGRLSHWLRIERSLLDAAGVAVGDIVAFEIAPVAQEPEPEVPSDLREALDAAPAARAVWEATTTIARLDWIHWIVSAKQAKTRAQRIRDACDMLASGKRRVCCFDPSGYYSKAFRAPDAVA
ncbi:MAG: YdeI/OmpD-associated family protein [Pseudomonadota bacterium]